MSYRINGRKVKEGNVQEEARHKCAPDYFGTEIKIVLK